MSLQRSKPTLLRLTSVSAFFESSSHTVGGSKQVSPKASKQLCIKLASIKYRCVISVQFVETLHYRATAVSHLNKNLSTPEIISFVEPRHLTRSQHAVGRGLQVTGLCFVKACSFYSRYEDEKGFACSVLNSLCALLQMSALLAADACGTGTTVSLNGLHDVIQR